MTQEELFSLADKVGLGFIKHASAKDIDKFKQFAALITSAEREAVLQTVEALYDSEDPTPMYQDGYNHALDHIEEFVKARGKHE
jgi:antibiotic biosynthesis monooxygenase (ABM) superfamily enzyme